MVIATLQDHAYASYTLAGDYEELPAVYAELTKVPPPMIENNWERDSECLTGETLRKAAVPELTAVRSIPGNSPPSCTLSSLLPGLRLMVQVYASDPCSRDKMPYAGLIMPSSVALICSTSTELKPHLCVNGCCRTIGRG